MAPSSRSAARRTGTCGVKPRRCGRYDVPRSVYRTWNSLSFARTMGPGRCHDLGTTLAAAVSFWGVRRDRSSRGAAGALALAVGVAFDDELVAGGGEPVDGGLGQQLVVHEAGPFIGGPVGGDDGGVVAVPGDGQLVEVGGGGLVQRLEREIVDDQQVHGGQAAVLGFGAVVQPGGFEASPCPGPAAGSAAARSCAACTTTRWTSTSR